MDTAEPEAGPLHTAEQEAGPLHTDGQEAGSLHTAEPEAGPLHTAEPEAGPLHTADDRGTVSAEEQSSGHKHSRRESYGRQFLYALLTFTLRPLRKTLLFI